MIVQDLETGQQTHTHGYTFTEKALSAHEYAHERIGYLKAKDEASRTLRELRDSYKKAGKLTEAKAVKYAMEKLR